MRRMSRDIFWGFLPFTQYSDIFAKSYYNTLKPLRRRPLCTKRSFFSSSTPFWAGAWRWPTTHSSPASSSTKNQAQGMGEMGDAPEHQRMDRVHHHQAGYGPPGGIFGADRGFTPEAGAIACGKGRRRGPLDGRVPPDALCAVRTCPGAAVI